MLHFVTSYMKQNKSRKQTLESAQYGLEISFNGTKVLVSKEIAVLRRQASLKLIKENLTIPAP